MRLTARDFVGTLLVGIGVLGALAALQGWGWPLLGDARAGIVVLLGMSVLVCPLGMGTPSATWYKDPFVLMASALGTAILVLGVIGLFGGAADVLVWMIGLTVASWIVTTAHHLVGAPTQRRMTPA